MIRLARNGGKVKEKERDCGKFEVIPLSQVKISPGSQNF